MTLVLTVETRTAVYQASDRRVFYLRGDGTIDRHDDEMNKAVVWCGRIAFAYCGFAEIGSQRRTDLWLAETLASIETDRAHGSETRRDQGWILSQLAERATDEFRRPPWSRVPAEDRIHAFVGVGWARFDGDPSFRPYRVLKSNFHDDDLREHPAARDAFAMYARPLADDDAGCLEVIPERISPEDVQRLIATVASADEPPSDPRLVVDLLVDEIRRVAEHDHEVGRGVLVNVIPKLAVETDSGFSVASEYEPDVPTFLYVPPDSPNGVTYGPTTTCQGGVMTNFSAGTPAQER